MMLIMMVSMVMMMVHDDYDADYHDRFEEQSHEIKEAQEKLSEIVLAKQVHTDLDLDDDHHDDHDANADLDDVDYDDTDDDDDDDDDDADDDDDDDDDDESECWQAKKGVDMERLALGPGGRHPPQDHHHSHSQHSH